MHVWNAELDLAKLGLPRIWSHKVKPRPALPNHHVISPLFWDTVQHRAVICYWCFGTTYQPHLQIQNREQSTTEVNWCNFFFWEGGVWWWWWWWWMLTFCGNMPPAPTGSTSLHLVHSPNTQAALQRIRSCSSGQCSVCSHPLTTTHISHHPVVTVKGQLVCCTIHICLARPLPPLHLSYKWPYSSSPNVHNLVLCSPQLVWLVSTGMESP